MARSMERHRDPSRERERDLVLAFQAGNATAYDSIDRTCRPAAERICRKLLINPADVEEAVQETMVRAYQGLPRFNGSYALTAWVARIATNVCLDTLRSRSRRPQNGGTIHPDMEARNGENGTVNLDPEELVQQAAEAEEVRKVLADMPERHRTALVLREFEGYSHKRIATMLDTSPQRVKALIHRAKAGFRRAWKDEGNGTKLAAFAPLLTPINWIRRMFGRAPEFDYSATASVANAAASPAAQTITAVASERISTAVAAVMLAGTVGFAVQNAPKASHAEDKPAVVQMVTAPAEPAVTEKATPKKKKKVKRHVKAEAAVAPLPEVSPTPEAAAEVAEEAGDDQKVDGPVPDETELPPHPSGVVQAFTSDRIAAQPCGCGGPQLNQTGLSVSEDGFSSFSAGLSGGIIDSTGQAGWAVQGNVSATIDRINVYFEIHDQFGTSIYDATGSQGTVLEEAWGGWTYTYTGTYKRRGGPVQHVDAPDHGSFSATVTVSWLQQRLVVATFALDDAT